MSKKQDITYLPTDGFLRSNTNPSAIINVDNSALLAYKRKRDSNRSKQEEINRLNRELSELKSLLIQVLEKNK
jgi:hypothetical protein